MYWIKFKNNPDISKRTEIEEQKRSLEEPSFIFDKYKYFITLFELKAIKSDSKKK